MGKEKRLFLLAVMTVMMSTAGYGKVITVKPGTLQAITKDNGDTYIVQAGKTGKTTIKVNGNVTFKDGIGIKYEKENENSAGQILGTVQNGKVLTVSGGTGIDFSGSTNDNDKFNNYGTINVTGGTGIYLDHGKVTNSEKNGGSEINVSGGTGINVAGGTFDNNKTEKGTAKVIVTGGTGIQLETGIINNGGNIEVSNKGSIGINQLDGTTENKGLIKVTGGATGVAVSGGKFSNTGKSPNGITVSGQESIGINQTGGEVSNTGKIAISGNGTGAKVSNGAVFVNGGSITGPKGTGIALENGVLINNKEIKLTDVNEGFAVKSLSGNNTVYLKKGSTIKGKIVGADGVDVLALEGTKAGKVYDGLYVENYEKISVVNGDVKIGNNSRIELEYTKDAEDENGKTYKDKTDEIIGGKDSAGNLTISNSTLIIDFKDSLTNPKGTNNPIIDVGDGKLIFGEGMKLDFTSSDGRDEFNFNEALGLKEGQIDFDKNINIDDIFKDTAVWEYDNSTGEIIAKRHKYEDVVLKPQLKEFSGILGNKENFNKDYKDTLDNLLPELNLIDTKEAFTNAVTQLSGGVHGYIADFAALNARTMTNTMRNRALTRDYMRKRPLNSWTQDISYIDNNHRLGGLMNVDYTEKGVLGISEKQILPNGRLGLVYGGSKGNAKFEGGQNGSSTLDGAYFGGYYNHEFNNKWSLNSNANFVYTHNKVTRNVNFADINENFKSAYPTYTVGMGSSLIYTVKDDLRNKAHFYAGVDVERIMVGNINENKDIAKDETGLAIKTTSYNPRTYYSIVPSAGFMVQNTGYVFDRKYRIGADLNWETEVGNIKDGKRLQLTGLDKEYKVETSEREDVFSYSLFGALDLTENLSVNARYTSMFSDEYDADMIGAGFEYKMDTMADNFFGTLAHKLENNRPFSDRWGGTFGLIMETDDVDDYTKYDDGHPTSGDVATSMEYKPKMILSLNDKQSNWSYYFEAYHKTNNMFGSIKSDERESHASRYHGEARWNDTYSKGSYGMSFGYRNENSRKSDYYASNKTREIVKNGTHELRITPSFTYDLGHGFTLGGKSAIVFMYKYEGDRAGQMDMNTESQIGFTYTGFMPRWSIIANFYREDTWYDHSYRKMTKVGNDYFDRAPKNDQVNQLRPSIIYYFGNGASFRFDARIPLGNGSWANLNDGTNGNQAYETRYGFNYYYPVTPGLTVNVGGIFLNNKTKNKDHSGGKYGNITRGYAFRPNIGFYYSF